jgi:hypothetical protein
MRSSVRRKIQPKDDIMQQTFDEVIVEFIFYDNRFFK